MIANKFLSLTKHAAKLLPQNGTIFVPARNGTSISVILLDQVDKKGGKGEIIEVKRGFARNYLIPRKIAAYATNDNKLKYKSLLEKAGKMESTVQTIEGETVASVNSPKVDMFKNALWAFTTAGKVIKIRRDSSSEKTLYSALTEKEVINALANLHISAKNVDFLETIKVLGDYNVVVDGLQVKLSVLPLESPTANN